MRPRADGGEEAKPWTMNTMPVVTPDGKQQWAEKYGVRQARQTTYCVCRLIGKQCRHGGSSDCPHAVPEADHPSLWLRKGKAVVLVSQPYQISNPERLGVFCRERDLRCMICTWPAWHRPGSVLHVEISRAILQPAVEWEALRALAGRRTAETVK